MTRVLVNWLFKMPVKCQSSATTSAGQMPINARTYRQTNITIQTDRHTGKKRITLCCTR